MQDFALIYFVLLIYGMSFIGNVYFIRTGIFDRTRIRAEYDQKIMAMERTIAEMRDFYEAKIAQYEQIIREYEAIIDLLINWIVGNATR